MAVEGLAKYKKTNEISLAEMSEVEYNKTKSSFMLYIFNGQWAERTFHLHVITRDLYTP